MLALLSTAFIAVGLLGGASYWEAYYQHRGFVAPARLHRAGAGHLLSVNFYSQALHRSADYLAYLPAGYTPAHRYPVFYLLHGMPGRPEVFIDIANMDIRLDNRLALGQVPPMILVFPDGRIGGSTLSDSEWANTPSGAFENYVLEVVRDVDSRFSTMPNRQARVIGGFSAGGYGAINIALHHLPLFGSVEVWSGYFTQTRTGVFAHATGAELAYNSPIDYVRTLARQIARYPLRAYMFVGRGDSASRQIVPMAKALDAAGVQTSDAIYKGGHDWQLWYGHLNQMLILAGRDALEPLTPAGPAARSAHARTTLGRHAHARRRVRRHAHHHRRAQRHRSIAATPVSGPPGTALAVAARGRGPGEAGLLAGLLIALISAASINLGFLLQQRGLVANRSAAGRWALVRAMLRSPAWLGGQALGWAGFAAQIIAVSLAPLAFVQSFAAGGLALSVPLAAAVLGLRVSRRQGRAVLLVAVGLAALPLGVATRADRLRGDRLALTVVIVLAAGLALAVTRRTTLLAIAAGLFYGVADACIKAVSVGWGGLGAAAVLSGWTALALATTFAGFVAFQAALRTGSAITGISLMNCLAALVALGAGLLAFGESLGRSPAVAVGHGVAIALVFACVPVLARAQAELSDASGERSACGEQQRLKPRAKAGHPRPQHVAEA